MKTNIIQYYLLIKTATAEEAEERMQLQAINFSYSFSQFGPRKKLCELFVSD